MSVKDGQHERDVRELDDLKARGAAAHQAKDYTLRNWLFDKHDRLALQLQARRNGLA